MITFHILDRLKYVIASVSYARLVPLGIPRCNCNQRILRWNSYNYRESIQLGVKHVVVIVIFREVIEQNKKVACNNFDDKGMLCSCHMGLTLLLMAMFSEVFWSDQACESPLEPSSPSTSPE